MAAELDWRFGFERPLAVGIQLQLDQTCCTDAEVALRIGLPKRKTIHGAAISKVSSIYSDGPFSQLSKRI